MIRRHRWKRWLLALRFFMESSRARGFFAPYDPAAQDRERPYLPPMKFIWWMHKGTFGSALFSTPCICATAPSINSTRVPIRPFLCDFVTGARYSLLGLIPSRMHLFGAQAGRVYLLGSDAYGRDQFSRILYGGQISLLAGLLGAGLTLFFGALIGATAGYYGGWRDGLLMRVAELFVALPWLYLLFALRAFLPLAVSPVQACLTHPHTAPFGSAARARAGVRVEASSRKRVRVHGSIHRSLGTLGMISFRRTILRGETARDPSNLDRKISDHCVAASSDALSRGERAFHRVRGRATCQAGWKPPCS